MTGMDLFQNICLVLLALSNERLSRSFKRLLGIVEALNRRVP